MIAMEPRTIIPEEFQRVLGSDLRLHSAVLAAFDSVGTWMSHSKTPFFPEYPEHDVSHVGRILSTAWILMSDQSRETVSAGDAAVLCCAALVHDSALHIDENSFSELVSPKAGLLIDERFNDQPWPGLWERYLEEVLRADQFTLRAIYGPELFPRRPPTDFRELTTQDRLVIGEFLRRHHHRLAYELTTLRLPTLRAIFDPIARLDNEMRDLIGLVARSHGLPLRECIRRLGGRDDVRDVLGVHLGFLMALIRLADYLDLNPERAPPQLAAVRRFASPVSEGEWRFTGSIKHIGYAKDDPECLDIQAVPPSPRDYQRVKAWVDDVEQELATAVGVIGEVYGRFPELPYALRFARTTSNLHSEGGVLGRLPYYPVEARLSTSGGELLKLLVNPLYSGRPEIAVRELVQNAVDAVNEFKRYCETTGATLVDEEPDEPDVTVELQRDTDGRCWLAVSDRGIGMTVETVTKYFLKVGSTYRRSEEWREMFAGGLGDRATLRAGRFGIGVLASFLLGREIEVQSRHASLPDSSGLRFAMTLDEEEVGIWKHSRKRGTTIRVRMA